MGLWCTLARATLRAYLAVFVEAVQVRGQENLHPGPKIMAANHPHLTDAFVLPFIIPGKLHFLIQADAFTVPWVGRLLTLADQIPVVVGQGRKALNAARAKLAQGHTIAIFPEGLSQIRRGCRTAGPAERRTPYPSWLLRTARVRSYIESTRSWQRGCRAVAGWWPVLCPNW